MDRVLGTPGCAIGRMVCEWRVACSVFVQDNSFLAREASVLPWVRQLPIGDEFVPLHRRVVFVNCSTIAYTATPRCEDAVSPPAAAAVVMSMVVRSCWRFEPSLASRSTVSLPSMPTCEGTHWKHMEKPLEMMVVHRVRMSQVIRSVSVPQL
jgi:hypothetical protein